MEEREATSSTLTGVLSADLVGRDNELAHLRAALDGTPGGEGGVVFVVGEAGIGKSRLTHAVVEEAAGRGFRVLRGRAVETGTPAAYRPLAEALTSGVRGGAAPDATVLGPFRRILGRLVPDWRVAEQPLEESLVAVAEGVLRFLSATAGAEGALVVLEDLHWADPETLTIVEYLADNLAAERVLCVVTVRDDEGSPGRELAWSLQARRVSELIQLSPLGEDEVAAMIRSCLGTREVATEVAQLAERAGGVPFLVEELLAAALASGVLVADHGTWQVVESADAVVPPTFSDNIARRIARLGEDGRTVLLAAAVLGRRFDWSLLPATTGLDPGEVLSVLHRAVDAQIVVLGRGDATFRFRHALSRDAVLAGLFPPELESLSRRALDAVESAHPRLGEDWCEVAAELAIGAGDRHRAATLFLEVARRASERGALASAEAMLERSRSLLPEDHPVCLDVDEHLLHVLSLAGKSEQAVDLATALLARLGNDPRWARRRVEILLRLARAAVAATRWDEAHDRVEQARLEAALAPGDDLAPRLDALRAQVAIVRDPERAPALARAALGRAERLGLADVACEALEVLGRSQRVHDLAGAEASFGRALAMAEANGLTVWRARALHELGAIDMLRGRSVSRLEEARELALAQGALATAAVVDVQIAAALVFADDPAPASAATRRSAELARRYRFDQTLAAALALEAYAHARLRRRGEMQRCIDEALALAPGVPDIDVKTATAAALLALIEEDRATARRHLSTAAMRAASGPGSVAPGIGLFALLHRLAGPDAAGTDVDIPEDSVHFVTSAFLRYATAVERGRTSASDAAASMAAGDHLLEDHRWLRHLGRRLVAEAAVRDGWGEPVAWLRESLDFFDRRGEEALASACRSLLRKAGVAVPRRRGDDQIPTELRALGVTSRELEVLRLVGMGLPNSEIADRLYLSPRTVERHLANLGAKTGAGRRSELVAYAARTVSGGSSAP